MKFVCDARKAASNLHKHKVGFVEGCKVFSDTLLFTVRIQIIPSASGGS